MNQPQRVDPASRGLADPDDERSNCGVGMVMDLSGGSDRSVVTDGLDLLRNLEHRGTTGAEPNTGDGAGILLQTPHEFFADELPIDLPETYAVGSLFLPSDDDAREALQALVESSLADRGVEVCHWRDVPTDNEGLGRTALDSEPDVWHAVVAPADPATTDPEAFDRALYEGRRVVETTVDEGEYDGGDRFYVVSLDRKTLVYKGLLTGEQLPNYYPDLRDDRLDSTFVMVHERFSTNTLGAWHLAHPYRGIVHNGEFNTIQGNVNWMRARETDLETEALDLDAVRPIIQDPDQSDTASVDNALELLTRTRDLPHALRMLVPEAWRGDESMDPARRDFYDYHASLVEPWDGPALVCATDGDRVGAVLDRNGLRPCRYDVTTDDRLVMASEAGALSLDESEIAERGRLQPGQLFLADPEEGRVVPDDEVFEELADDRYGEWVDDEQVDLAARAPDDPLPADSEGDLRARQTVYGYTRDELDHLLEPMSKKGKDPVGSMGDDTPLSVLSDYNRPLFSYFKQLFAQVTNPPLDYIREELVTSLETRMGFQRNMLAESPAHARQLVADSPVLTDAELRTVRDLDGDGADGGITSRVVDVTFDADTDLESAVERVRADAAAAIEAGADVVVLSDRRVGPDRLPVPSLLATGAVHHHLVRNGLRNHAGLVVESGDPRTVHHTATLVGYGADAINPYIAFRTIEDVTRGPEGADLAEAIEAYVRAVEGGLLKTMAKMGISTVESYQGAQIFEAVGLDSDFVGEYFEGTENRTEGVDIEDVEDDLRARHETAYATGEAPELERSGEHENRSGGLHHQWNPNTVGTLQGAVRSGDYEQYGEFAEMINDQNEQLQTLRGLLSFDSDRDPIPIEDVEPVHEIVERISTAAMSLGSLSPEAHENNAVAMNRLGGKANTGEGGEPPERFDTEKECAVKQVASGRFGVTATYLANADELQIKMAQGSKPGEGGHLPGEKVNEMIAHVRKSTAGVGLISPPPLHDIYSIEDLKQLIYDLKASSPDADINVKLVSEAGIGTIAAGVAKANADVIHISGHDGGTGASPRTSIKNAGLPWELGLAEANQTLRRTGLRDRVTLTADGGLKTGRDVAVAALLGAEEYVFGTASLVTGGCVMARQCHKNTCPVGVATQREDLRARYPGMPEHVINYVTYVVQELREIMAELGFESVDEMIGRVDCLTQQSTDHPTASKLDLSAVLADVGDGPRRKLREQDHELDGHLDRELIEAAEAALDRGEPVGIATEVSNTDRTVGAVLSNAVASEYGEAGLPANTVNVSLRGTAGQSFGAFLASGVSLHLVGGANDHVGKGLSGGRITVETPADAGFDPADNVAVGNVALYGATDGECYVNGMAGERFAVRNSGANAVVEGVGDHGCEYMTSGVVAVLGGTGTNFAAGMSGGVAYVFDEDDTFAADVNEGMVHLDDALDDRDRAMLRRLVENHVAYTDSDRGRALLEDWDAALDSFVKVMPDAYERVMAEEGADDVREDLPKSASVDAGAGRTGVASSDD